MPLTKQPLQGERLRLHYLDGLRGLAAFYVVLHHAFLEVAAVKNWLPPRWVENTRWAWNGQIAVQTFIVLSGYCLMIPVARAGRLKGGRLNFIKRRARRILPPYYMALALSLAVTFIVPGMGTLQGLRWDLTLPAFAPGTLVSHLLLLQDIKPGYISRINYAMWSIAQEWQIYFVFAFLLLPIWRYAGILPTLIFTLVISVALRLFPHDYFFYAAPEFLFLFGVGMFAACVSFADSSDSLVLARDKIPWTYLSAALWMLYVGATWWYPDQEHFRSIAFTLLAGGAILCTLMLCTNSVRHRQGYSALLSILEWEVMVALGAFSYSLYLVHAPVLGMCTLAIRRLHLSGQWAMAIELFVAVPVATVVAYGFHLLAERPFMQGHPENLKRSEKAAILDPAP